MASDETIRLYDADDNLIDTMTLPPHFMEHEPQRWVIAHGKKFLEGGGPDSFYGKGQFAEVPK